MAESMRTRLRRWIYNFYPAYRGTGAWVTYIDDHWKEIRVRLPLSWRTRNVVGTIFGGSLYASVDPFFMIILIQRLGPDYVVWDKAASIRFKRPGRETLYARFTIDETELNEIRRLLQTETKIDRVYVVELKDREGVVHARVEKIIHISKRNAAETSVADSNHGDAEPSSA